MSIETRGPIFDGRAEAIVARMCEDIAKTVGDKGKQMVSVTLPTVLRHPTGRYQSGIRSEAHGLSADVTDGGIIYGPWLEGVGSRNRTTRFKGYATFRRVCQALKRSAVPIARPVVDRYVRKLG
jgi:hypothetical protein